MAIATKSLWTLTANEVMSRDLVTIPQAMSLAAAARILAHARISGAPVVDRDGRLIGVISLWDIAAWAGKPGHPARRPPPESEDFHSPWQLVDARDLPPDEVSRHMTTNTVTARPSTPLAELSRMMVDAHIHRIIVVDDEHRPIGIVSSTDILGAVARHGREDSPAHRS